MTAPAIGNGASSNNGAVTTTSANCLIIGANLVQTITSGAGNGFARRITTSPDGDILEDRVVTALGSYSATAPVIPSLRWIMQLVAFKAHPQWTASWMREPNGSRINLTLTSTVGVRR